MNLRNSLAAGATLLMLGCGSAYAECLSRPDEANLWRHDCYVNTDHYDVHRPSATIDGSRPMGATAQCRDGTWSFSQHQSGTCSHHGGVAR